MRVTSKGQVTIPLEVRRHLGLEKGSDVSFVRREDGAVQLVRNDETSMAGKLRADAVVDWLARHRNGGSLIDINGMTADEYIEFIRGPRDDLGPR